MAPCRATRRGWLRGPRLVAKGHEESAAVMEALKDLLERRAAGLQEAWTVGGPAGGIRAPGR